MPALQQDFPQLIDELRAIVGRAGWTTDPVDLEPQLRDWVGYAEGSTPIMVMPKNDILKCREWSQ